MFFCFIYPFLFENFVEKNTILYVKINSTENKAKKKQIK